MLGSCPDADFPVTYGEKGGLHVLLKGKADTKIVSMHAGTRPNIVIGKAEMEMAEWNETLAAQFDFYLRSNQLQGSAERKGDHVILHIDGVFSHAAEPYNGVNAALHLLNFAGCAYDDKFARDTYEMLHDWQGKPLGIDQYGAYMGFLTMNTASSRWTKMGPARSPSISAIRTTPMSTPSWRASIAHARRAGTIWKR